MIIDFEQIKPASINGFKGGKGELIVRNYADNDCKIMRHILTPGASSGLHTHEGNCEIVFILKGTVTFHYDDRIETATVGQVHYCPKGHSHYMENLTDSDVEYFAIVPELRD